MITRPGAVGDSAAIARIYNEGIEDRVATFETRLRSAAEIEKWFDGSHPIAVAIDEHAQVIAFANASTYRPRECYAGIAECSVYVARVARGLGAGRAVLTALHHAARAAGFHKLVSRVFPENTASLRMLDSLGWRRVGVYHRHGQLDGVWRDVIIVEKLL
jgi:L-amino acid N-acyltransferase YncA